MAAEQPPSVQILRARELMLRLRISRAQIQRLRRLDPTFPRPIALGIAARCALGWFQPEVENWIANRPRPLLPSQMAINGESHAEISG
jgi:predicted DNA-binding transcriptional regulator AlpA